MINNFSLRNLFLYRFLLESIPILRQPVCFSASWALCFCFSSRGRTQSEQTDSKEIYIRLPWTDPWRYIGGTRSSTWYTRSRVTEIGRVRSCVGPTRILARAKPNNFHIVNIYDRSEALPRTIPRILLSMLFYFISFRTYAHLSASYYYALTNHLGQVFNCLWRKVANDIVRELNKTILSRSCCL